MYIEDKASGQSIIQELKRESGMSVIPYKIVNDKVARVNAILPLIEGGRVFLPQVSPWLDSFVDEAVTFPNGNHDDQVDALSITLDVLSRTSISVDAWELQGDITQSLNHAPDTESSFGKSLKLRVNKAMPKWAGWGTL